MKQKPSKRPAAKESDVGPAATNDPVIEARVERAVAPYKDLVSPEDLGFMKETLRLYLASHPDVSPLVDRLRPRADAGSGDRPRAGLEPASEAPPAEQKVKPGSR